jgi:hypothetical protein
MVSKYSLEYYWHTFVDILPRDFPSQVLYAFEVFLMVTSLTEITCMQYKI